MCRAIIWTKTVKSSALRELIVYKRIPAKPSRQQFLFQQKFSKNLVSEEKPLARKKRSEHWPDLTLIQENDLDIFVSRKMKHH